MWAEVLARFEKKAPASVMAKLALEQAIAADWVDQVFEEHRQRQYPRELLFSTIIKLMSLVSLGLRPSLHAAARQMDDLPVSLAALYDKVSRTEPGLLRALVTDSVQRLAPTIEELGHSSILPGWQVRVVDGSHLPSTDKRLDVLREQRGAARPGFSVVVYDPDLDQIVDLQPCEDAYASERVSVMPLLEKACAGQLWMADRLYCTHPGDGGLRRCPGLLCHSPASQTSATGPRRRMARTARSRDGFRARTNHRGKRWPPMAPSRIVSSITNRVGGHHAAVLEQPAGEHQRAAGRQSLSLSVEYRRDVSAPGVDSRK